MKKHVQKSGNGMADSAAPDESAEVEITLEELLSQVTPENVHDEITTSAPVGNEAW
jgi:antitoxin component of MazEF toxin-antitoxin module